MNTHKFFICILIFPNSLFPNMRWVRQARWPSQCLLVCKCYESVTPFFTALGSLEKPEPSSGQTWGESGLWNHWCPGKEDRFLGNEWLSAFWKKSWMLLEPNVWACRWAVHGRSSIRTLFKVESILCWLLIACLLTSLVERTIGKRSHVFPLFASKMDYFTKLFY